ncbi:MAG: hypothetical protein D3916_00740 [Candidatus Electrothrix sp. MAN1_4]|nr:hypothetical protein [Candidatus Electrothrix sp. MAN1_4]
MKRKKKKLKKKKPTQPRKTAQARLAKKIRRSGKKVSVNPQGLERMSDVIEEFAEPLLADCRNADEAKKAIQFAMIVWNLTLLPEKEQDNKIQEMLDALSPSDKIDAITQTRYFINLLITRKKKMFPDIKRTVIDFQLSGSGSNLRLDIASTMD